MANESTKVQNVLPMAHRDTIFAFTPNINVNAGVISDYQKNRQTLSGSII